MSDIDAETAVVTPTTTSTTIPNVFEVKKRWNGVVFGDAEDLKSILATYMLHEHPQRRHFFRGNYSMSIVKNVDEDKTKSSSVVVLHQENVDPKLVFDELLEWNKSGRSPRGRCGGVRMKNIFGPSDWFAGQRTKIATSEGGDLKIPWNVPPQGGNELFYCFDGHGWFANDIEQVRNVEDTKIVSSSNAVYNLEREGRKIGVAINLEDFFPRRGFSCMLYCDENGGCFALVLHQFSENGEFSLAEVRRRCFTVCRIESFLFGNVCRSFCNDGVAAADNPYYGTNGTPDFNFSSLPDNIFVKILRYIPWRDRVLFRRVDHRWLGIEKESIGIDTPIMNVDDVKFRRIRPNDVKWLLSIVHWQLEELKIRRNEFLAFLDDVDFLKSISSFSKLRKIDFGGAVAITNLDAMIMLLKKSKKLEVLTMSIPEISPPIDNSVSFDQVKHFTACDVVVTDSQLTWISNRFPRLTSLRVVVFESVSISTLSTVIQKYALGLTRLEVKGVSDMVGSNGYPTGSLPALAECRSLEYVSLHFMNFVTDGLLAALATGCPNLAALDVSKCRKVTNEGLKALTALPKLKRLNVSTTTRDLNDGIFKLAQCGLLEELVADDADLTPACLKSCVRRCAQLKLLAITDNEAEITEDDTTQIVATYSEWGRSKYLILRSSDGIWSHVREVRGQRRFVVRNRGSYGFLNEKHCSDGDEEDDIDDSLFIEDEDLASHTLSDSDSNGDSNGESSVLIE